jgi:hypothetical protein
VDEFQFFLRGQARLDLNELPPHLRFLQHFINRFQALMRFRMIRIGLVIQISIVSDNSGS